jgi:hypothetical protein
MTPYSLHHEAVGEVNAIPEVLFAHLDDPLRLSSHMQQRSMALMGTSMDVRTDALGGMATGSIIRMQGRVLGVPLRLEEVVVQRQPPQLKAWVTLGEPRLLVIGAYRMGFRIAGLNGGSVLTIFIDYDLPLGGPARWASRWLAPVYARWCCSQMLRDAQNAFRPAAGQQARS